MASCGSRFMLCTVVMLIYFSFFMVQSQTNFSLTLLPGETGKYLYTKPDGLEHLCHICPEGRNSCDTSEANNECQRKAGILKNGTEYPWCSSCGNPVGCEPLPSYENVEYECLPFVQYASAVYQTCIPKCKEGLVLSQGEALRCGENLEWNSTEVIPTCVPESENIVWIVGAVIVFIFLVSIVIVICYCCRRRRLGLRLPRIEIQDTVVRSTDHSEKPTPIQFLPTRNTLFSVEDLRMLSVDDSHERNLMLFQPAEHGDVNKLIGAISEQKEDLKCKNSEGRTLLHIAVWKRRFEFVQQLLNNYPQCLDEGLDLDRYGYNALHLCALNGDVDMYMLLTNAGFDTKNRTGDNKNLIDLARDGNHGDLIECIVNDVQKDLSRTHRDIQVGKMVDTDEDMIVVYTDEPDARNETIDGMNVMHRYRKQCNSDDDIATDFELSMNCNGLSEAESETLQNVVTRYSNSLWNNHKNLTGISGSAVRTQNGNAHREMCIVLYCKFKGFIPRGEKSFPTHLSLEDNVEFATDVRECFFESYVQTPSDLLIPLHGGGEIRRKWNTDFGTIGPFVSLRNGDVAFLTCAHCLFRSPLLESCTWKRDISATPDSNSVVQPGSRLEMVCGKVIDKMFKPNENPSIDAALVKITKPERVPNFGQFAILTGQSSTAGNEPVFNTGQFRKPSPDCHMMAFGSTTGRVNGKYGGNGQEISFNFPHGPVIMKGLLKQLSFEVHKPGDSGSGVYEVDNDGNLYCVGMLVGGTGRTGYLVPIENILNSFNLESLKSF